MIFSNKINGETEEPIPLFYGWECVSLKLPNRTLDFVIKDSKQIIKFLQAVNLLSQVLQKEE